MKIKDNPSASDYMYFVVESVKSVFGKDVLILGYDENNDFMGAFQVTFQYLPIDYYIVLESERGKFTIIISDSSGASTLLYRFHKYNGTTSFDNIQFALKALKEELEKNDFDLYYEVDKKLYKKRGNVHKRVKNIYQEFNVGPYETN